MTSYDQTFKLPVAFEPFSMARIAAEVLSAHAKTMFRTAGGCVFTMAGDNVKQIREEAVGGKKIVRIKGTVSDSGELTVSSYRIVKSLDSGASAM